MPTYDHTYTSPNSDPRDTAISLIILHATVGSAKSALAWLVNPDSKVSTHYLINKGGRIYQLVAEDRNAWHAGQSAWPGVSDVNEASIGIELENKNDGKDPYPETQRAALVSLIKDIKTRHAITDILTHAQVARPAGRKTDPRGLDVGAITAQVEDTPTAPYSADSPLLAPARAPLSLLASRFPIFDTPATEDYSENDVRFIILPAYFAQAQLVGIDPVLAIAQMAHETDTLTAFWALRPQRNPAGIGVNGDHSATRPRSFAGWAFNSQRLQWERGASFKDWVKESIPAHLGRLLAYALTDEAATPFQRTIIARALAVRDLPKQYRGVAPTLRGLNARWAVGEHYADGIARWANRLTT